MQSDLPHTLLKYDRGDGKKTLPRPRADDPAFKKSRERLERYRAMKAAKERGEIPMTTDELFNQK